jgi:pimeloyl-ACP methyl ester carboxylesterase
VPPEPGGPPLRGERRRDGQQWVLDWLIKQTGRVQNFEYDHRMVPPEVKAYAQIPRVMERYARHREDIARAAERSGHHQTAASLYWRAAECYREAQHAIYRDDDSEKLYLHSKMLECFDKIIEFAPNPIERVEIPFEGNLIQGLLHMTPSGDRAPAVVFCPGMDMTKETYLDPLQHPFVVRGLNCLHIDGPGQGMSNIRKIRVDVDNYERAGSAAIDYLGERPEVDPDRIGVSGFSMGSYWGMRLAATDSRVKAVATAAACYGPKRAIFEESSPRFKQIFMYMSGLHDEDQFDAMAERMTLETLAPKTKCPTLVVTGEYDPLAPLEEVLDIYEQIPRPKELWVIEDDFHNPNGTENLGGAEIWGFLADWLRDALDGKLSDDLKREVLVPRNEGLGPYSESSGMLLPERLEKKITGDPLKPPQGS